MTTKCVKSLVNFNSQLVLNNRFNDIIGGSGHHSCPPTMPRVRAKSRPLSGHKYSSLWFARKAIQMKNSKLLANNSSISRPLINYNQRLSLMNGTDEKQPIGQRMDTKGVPNGESSASDSNDSVMASIDSPIASGVEVFLVGDRKAVVLMTDKDLSYELSFGCIRLTLLSEDFRLNLNGFELSGNQSIELMAAFGHKIWIKVEINENKTENDRNLSQKLQELGVEPKDDLLNRLQTTEDNLCPILVEKLSSASLLYIENMPNYKPLNLKSNSHWFEFKAIDRKSVQFVEVWDKLFDELNICTNDVIVVTGAGNVGKSSLIRHFINRYLSRKELDQSVNCFYLDCDPGQSEFGTSAQLSLTQIERPLLSSATMNVLNIQPLMSCSVGATTPTKEPKIYISGVIQLANVFGDNHQSKGPLFVNTMGWTRDLGLALLTDTIKTCGPTHVIQIDSNINSKVNFASDLTPEYIKSFPGFMNTNETNLDYKLSIIGSDNKESKRSQITRVSQQLTYFSRCRDIVFKPFFAMRPLKFKWSEVFVHIIWDTRFSPPFYLDVLNLSWVHLCRIDVQNRRIRRYNGIQVIDSIEGNQCLGSAIIRGIDFNQRCFYILTPERSTTLKDFNCIVKPHGVFVPDSMITEQNNYSRTSSLPYIYHKS